ncbi:MAG: MarR family winged helix-turn-helix transcriptional regulator [Verrucomicrobiota bacterium]|nr:MarR family winged helix-turn-helix transcriptional regulator [Verrucomicrobiota bacterium]
MAVDVAQTLTLGTESVGFYLSRASIVFRDLLKRSLESSSLHEHIKPGMGNLMFALFEKDGQTKTELAQKLHLSKMTITRLVRDVEREKLVKTVADDHDGRATRVRLTPLAKRLEPEYRKLAVQLEERIAARFTRAQLAEFRGYLETLVDYLESDKA